MERLARLLLVDDEETFRLSTADLLRLENYHVDTAGDADGAIALLKEYRYDLVIADIQMPGNSQLEFINELAEHHEGLPVILVTGYPSTETAIKAVGLPVAAYLVKPLDIAELKESCRRAIQGMSTYRAVDEAQQRMAQWQTELDMLKKSIPSSIHPGSEGKIQSYIQISLKNIMASIVEMNHLTATLAGKSGADLPCQKSDCPELVLMKQALVHAVEVLEQTKQSFKSKQLFALREALEDVLMRVDVS